MDKISQRVPLESGVMCVSEKNGNRHELKIESVISFGGSCIVYKGYKIEQIGEFLNDRAVIIKEFYPSRMAIGRDGENALCIPEERYEEFEKKRELFLNGQSRHSKYYELSTNTALPRAFLYGEANNTAYAISDPSAGKTLAEINRSTLSLSKISAIMMSLCRCFFNMHSDCFYYLDCKPENIFIIEDRAYLFDFDTLQKGLDLVKNKYEFCASSEGCAAPEQLEWNEFGGYKNSDQIGVHTDIFSIGAVFFWLLTGRKPTKDDLDDIQSAAPHWMNESLCAGSSEEILKLIERISKKLLQEDVEKRMNDFFGFESVKRLVYGGFEELYSLTLGDGKEYAPLHEEHTEIIRLLNEIKDNAAEISIDYELPTSTNRFKYNSNSTRFLGRQEEFHFFLEMCQSDSVFCWAGLCGKGGSGKTRLAYELCKQMKEKGWLVFAPLHLKSNRDKLSDALAKQKSNILICLDYIKQDQDEIIDLIRSIIETPHKGNSKIRLVLIEREREDVIVDDYAIAEYKYESGIVELGILPDEVIQRIVIDYITRQNPQIHTDQIPLDLIMNTIQSVDREYRRPLFALFIADAWLNNEELTKWDKKAALDYLLCKERARLSSAVKNPKYGLSVVDQEKRFLPAIESLYVSATYFGKILYADYAEKMEEQYRIKAGSDSDALLAILKECSILTQDGSIIGLEPDLLGEYFCVDYFNRLTTEDLKLFVGELIQTGLPSFIRYTEMIYRDEYFEEIVDEDKVSVLRDLNFPLEYLTVRKNQFRECHFLRNINFGKRLNTIQAGAFRDCKNLEKILFPASLENIEKFAFKGCEKLVEVSPEDDDVRKPSLISIQAGAFSGCVSLQNIIIPTSTQKLGSAVFENCVSLKEFFIPPKIKIIEDSSFMRCSSLADVRGAIGVESIERDAFYGCSSLKSISFSKKLCSIADNAFSDCSSLTEIDLSPCRISRIPMRLFWGCSSLTRVWLPHALTTIHEKAFEKCSSLVDIHFSDTLKTIGRSAFSGCEKLLSVAMPKSLKNVDSHAFEGCSALSQISFATPPLKIGDHVFSGCRSLSFSSVSGLDFSSKCNFSGFAFSSFTEREFDFIKNYSEMDTVILPDTITSIGDDAFRGHENLCTVTLPQSIKTISARAFSNCLHLETVFCYNGTISVIGDAAFSGCSALKSFSGTLAVSRIGEAAFSGCESLETIRISGTMSEIGKAAFRNCKNLKSLNLTSRIMPRRIGINAFVGCESLRYYPLNLQAVGESPRNFDLEGFVFNSFTMRELNFLRKYWTWETVAVPNSCIAISENVFAGCRELKCVILPDSIKKLPDGLFEGCKKLVEVVLPKHLKKLPARVFQGCISLKTFSFGSNSKNTIPSGVSIEPAAFAGCARLAKLYLPEDLKQVKRATFQGCKLLNEITIPDGMESIGVCAFLECRNLEQLKLPRSLNYLGNSALKNCTSLRSVEGLEETQITVIQNNTFESCYNLETLKLPRHLQAIRGSAFKDCHSLVVKSNFLPATLTYIEDAAFQGCYRIQRLSIPKGIEEIRDYTFKSCSSLQRVVFMGAIKHIGQSAFYHCNNMDSEGLILPESLESIGVCAFAYCQKLSHLTIPSGVSSLSDGLLKGCVALEAVKISGNVSKISLDCFKDCVRLKQVDLPANLYEIGVGAFRNCQSLSSNSFCLPENLHVIHESAFRYCDSLETICVPENVTTIPASAFLGCTNLKCVQIQGKLLKVGGYAFEECLSLESFPFEKIIDEIGDAAFARCPMLRSPTFSDTIRTIGSAAFRGCLSITQISLPLSVKMICGATFKENVSLRSVHIPESVTMVKKSAFRECTSLYNVQVDSSRIEIGSKAFQGCAALDYIDLPEGSILYADSFKDCLCEEDLKEDNRFRWRSFGNSDPILPFVYSADTRYNGIEIKRYTGMNETQIIVPSEIDGVPVVSIGDSCFEERHMIEEVQLPPTICYIGENAFAYCKRLERLNLSPSIGFIGQFAFKDCHALAEIQLPDSLREIHRGTFSYCRKLRSVSLPSHLERIGEIAFLACPLDCIVIPESTKSIEVGAFAQCSPSIIQSAPIPVQELWFK